MEAKDTVISFEQWLNEKDGNIPFDKLSDEIKLTLQIQYDYDKATRLLPQAEISFKAGIREALWRYAWMKDGIYYVGTMGMTYKEALKEWGVEIK